MGFIGRYIRLKNYYSLTIKNHVATPHPNYWTLVVVLPKVLFVFLFNSDPYIMYTIHLHKTNTDTYVLSSTI